MDLYQHAAEWKAELLRGERDAARRMTDAYGTAWQAIRERLAVLQQQMQAARAAGEDIRASWLLERRRLNTLLEQVSEELTHWSGMASGEVVQQQRIAAQQGVAAATEAVESLAGFARVNTGAVQSLVGVLGDGTPVDRAIRRIASEGVASVRSRLIAGVTIGQGPRAIERLIRKDLGGGLVGALTICRTETMRAYRQANLTTYRENSDVVGGWIWLASKTTRTCAVCLVMDGTEHPLDEDFGSHVNCRCTSVPKTPTWGELLGSEFADIPEPEPIVPRETGRQWLLRQPDDKQIAVLGPAKHAALKDGRLHLDDLVGMKHDDDWGTVRYERSLKDILSDA